VPHFPPQGAGYLTLLSRHSLGNGTIKMLPFRSLRWGMNCKKPIRTKENIPDYLDSPVEIGELILSIPCSRSWYITVTASIISSSDNPISW